MGLGKDPDHTAGTGKGEEKSRHKKESGRHEGGSSGADRPSGGRTARDSTSINPESRRPIHPDSPEMPPA